MDDRIDGWISGWMNRRTDGRMDGWVDKSVKSLKNESMINVNIVNNKVCKSIVSHTKTETYPDKIGKDSELFVCHVKPDEVVLQAIKVNPSQQFNGGLNEFLPGVSVPPEFEHVTGAFLTFAHCQEDF